MDSLILRTIRALAAPEYRLCCKTSRWCQGLAELRQRGRGERESGAFLLGTVNSIRRRIHQFVYYEDLVPDALDRGYIKFNRQGFPELWQLCRSSGLQVVGDVHTHPDSAFLSSVDRANPMIPQQGHIAIILPNYAQDPFSHQDMSRYGIYIYQGGTEWTDRSGSDAYNFFYIGLWG